MNKEEQEIARLILKEIDSRLSFLINVGLEYLTLDRAARTLEQPLYPMIRYSGCSVLLLRSCVFMCTLL